MTTRTLGPEEKGQTYSLSWGSRHGSSAFSTCHMREALAKRGLRGAVQEAACVCVWGDCPEGSARQSPSSSPNPSGLEVLICVQSGQRAHFSGPVWICCSGSRTSAAGAPAFTCKGKARPTSWEVLCLGVPLLSACYALAHLPKGHLRFPQGIETHFYVAGSICQKNRSFKIQLARFWRFSFQDWSPLASRERLWGALYITELPGEKHRQGPSGASSRRQMTLMWTSKGTRPVTDMAAH